MYNFLNKYIIAQPLRCRMVMMIHFFKHLTVSFFLCHLWVLFVQFLMKLHLRCVYMKRLYKGKIKQYINYGSSGESLPCFRLWFIFQMELTLNITLFTCIDVCISRVSSLCKGRYIQRNFKYIYAS